MRRDVVAVACSAGGLPPLQRLLAGLPADLEAVVLLVQHVPAYGSRLASVLARSASMAVADAVHGQPLLPGRIFVAPAGRHLVVHDGELWLADGPKINRVRPAADALFRSAARWCGPRTVAVVLSGALDDGAAGAAAIAERGGRIMVQDPDEADYAGMPGATLTAVPTAVSVRSSGLARAVCELIGQPVTGPTGPLPEELIWETDMTEAGVRTGPLGGFGIAAGITCPDCHGGMRRIDSGATHYRCHVGHSYSPQTLLAAQAGQTEDALWQAVAILEEQAMVRIELARRCADRGRSREQREHLAAADRATQAADAVRAYTHVPQTTVAGSVA